MSHSVHAPSADKVGDVLLPALDCLRVGLSLFDGDDRLVYCNEHFRYIYRSFDSVDELLGLTFTEILRLQLANGEIAGRLAVDDAERWIRERLLVRADIRSKPIEQRLTDGRWIHVKERPIANGGFIGLWQDITDLKKAQIAIEDAVESTSDGFALWDQSDRLIIANPRFSDLHIVDGQRPEPRERFLHVLSRTAKLFQIDQPEEDWIDERLRRQWNSRQEMVVQHKTGRWLLIKDRRTRDGGSATIMTDVTEFKENERELVMRGKSLERTVHELEMVQSKLEENGQQLAEMAEELQVAKVMAEQSSASKSAFLSNMSHELRTPLNAIIGFAEVIRDSLVGPLGNPKYNEYAQDIHAAGSHLLELINDILDLAKIESGHMELDLERVVLREAINGAIRLMEPKAREAHLGIEIDIAPDCGVLVADDRAFRQALLNLISNAVKFTPAGGRIGVRVTAGTDGGIDVSVWDTGVGIAAKDLGRVIQRFEQVRDPMTSDNKGTGLGLAIVQSLMELHGGRFYLQSEAGRGTTATLAFPGRAAVEAAA